MKVKVHTIKWSELSQSQRNQLNAIAAAGKLKSKEDLIKALIEVGAARG